MKAVVLAFLGVCLVGCTDPSEIYEVKRAVMEGLGSTARVDMATHRRLKAIEKKLKITPAPGDVEEVEAIIDGIQAFKDAQAVK